MSDEIGFLVLYFLLGVYVASAALMWFMGRSERKLNGEHRAEMKQQAAFYEKQVDYYQKMFRDRLSARRSA